MVAVVTIGFVKDAVHHIDVSGFNVYHKNRLIKVSFAFVDKDRNIMGHFIWYMVPLFVKVLVSLLNILYPSAFGNWDNMLVYVDSTLLLVLLNEQFNLKG